MARIGLVAGDGKLPIIFSQVARKKGDTVIGFGLKGVTQDELKNHVDKMHWLSWGDFTKALLLLATERINKLILLGKIKKEAFFKDSQKFDDETRKILEKVKDKKDYAILNEVTKVFNKIGIEVIDSTIYLKDLMPSKGVLTKCAPAKDEWADINYGLEVAKELSRYDIGQTVAIKDKTVIALEAAEGTDETISRAGRLTDGGFIIVKAARPDQDMRFDVPLTGLDTLKALIEAKGAALAVEEKRTLLLDRDELVKMADEKAISIVVV